MTYNEICMALAGAERMIRIETVDVEKQSKNTGKGRKIK